MTSQSDATKARGRLRETIGILVALAVIAAVVVGFEISRASHDDRSAAVKRTSQINTVPTTSPTANSRPKSTVGYGITCRGPEVIFDGGNPQVTWSAAPNREVTIGGKMNVNLEKGTTLRSIKLVVSDPKATGDPLSLKKGIDVLTAGANVVTENQAPSAASLKASLQEVGRYPVWALIEYTPCDGGDGYAADPVGFVSVK